MGNVKINLQKSNTPTNKNQPTNMAPKKKSKKPKKSFLRMILAVLIPVLLASGAVYAWQQSVWEKNLKKSKEITKKLKSDYEKEISLLDSKIKNIKNQKSELEKNNEELKKKAELLNGAKKDFINESLGISFFYPVVYGEIEFSQINGDNSSHFKAKFKENKNLIFGGPKKDYKTSEDDNYFSLFGFEKKKDEYFLRYLSGDKVEEIKINPIRVFNEDYGEILVLDNTALAEAKDKLKIVLDDDDVLYLFNLKKEDYPAIVFVDLNKNDLPESELTEIFKTINLK